MKFFLAISGMRVRVQTCFEITILVLFLTARSNDHTLTRVWSHSLIRNIVSATTSPHCKLNNDSLYTLWFQLSYLELLFLIAWFIFTVIFIVISLWFELPLYHFMILQNYSKMIWYYGNDRGLCFWTVLLYQILTPTHTNSQLSLLILKSGDDRDYT